MSGLVFDDDESTLTWDKLLVVCAIGVAMWGWIIAIARWSWGLL